MALCHCVRVTICGVFTPICSGSKFRIVYKYVSGCSEEEHNICQVFINETVAHNLEEIENGKHEKWIII